MKFPEENLPSNKHFGIFLISIFSLVTIYALYKAKLNLLLISSTLIVIIATLIFFKPHFLNPFNKAWMYFGFLLGRIVSPIILGILFFLLITPIALIMKIIGRDELELKAINFNSAWRKRGSNQASDSFKNQF